MTSTYQCPGCETQVIWSSDNPWRPFCSESCKNKDFIAWANEEKRIPGHPDFDDLMSEELQ